MSAPAFASGLHQIDGVSLADLQLADELGDRTEIGSIFSKLFKPMQSKVAAKVSTNLSAQGASAANVALYNQAAAKGPTTKDLGKGLVTTVKLGAAVAAFIVPGGAIAGTAVLGATVGADKLLAAAGTAGKIGEQARSVIDTTKSLAAQGSALAKNGMAVLNTVNAARITAGVAAGVAGKVTASGAAAFEVFKAQVKPLTVSASVASKLAAAVPSAAAAAAAPATLNFIRRAPLAAPVPAAVTRAVFAPVAKPVAKPAPAPAAAAAPKGPRWLVTDVGAVYDNHGAATSAKSLWAVYVGKVVRT